VSWYLPLLRAVPALVLAVVITFSPDHSSALGLIALGGYGVVGGVVVAWGGAWSRGVERAILVAQGGILGIVGIAALFSTGGGLPYLIFLLSSAAALTGILELYLGLRGGPLRRDRLFAGVLTALLAIVVLLVPPGLERPIAGVEGSTGVLTASTIVVGLFGAYLAVLGVYLVIAGLSMKWAGVASTVPAPAAATSDAP
jgi:uncharacterized membrane protein HdeD (DUF308 family)